MTRMVDRWMGPIWLVLLFALAFGVSFVWQNFGNKDAPVRTKVVDRSHELHFARGEYFVRFHDDHLHRIHEVLAEHDAELVFPIMPNWVLVVEKRHKNRREFLPFSHESVPEYVSKADKLLADDAIISASFNHDIRSQADQSPANAPVIKGIHASHMVSDPFFGRQWNLQEAKPWQMGAANIDIAWEITKGSPKVTVGFIEQGFMLAHPDLANDACKSRFLPGYDFRSFSRLLSFGEHGTNVLGVVGACSNNKVGIAGVDWNAKILPVVRGTTTAETLLSILWASGYDNCAATHLKCRNENRIPKNLSQADVINLSFHVFPRTVRQRYQKYIARDYWLETVEMVNQRKSILVAASGNESLALRRNLDMPAGAEGVISVGSIDRNGYSLQNSRFGPDVSTLAAGDQVLTTATGPEKYAPVRGTSFAAPMVAGVVSLMKSVYQPLNWKTADYFIKRGAGHLSCEQYCGKKIEKAECEDLCCGSYGTNSCPGPINAFKSVQLAKACADPADDSVCSTVNGLRYPKATLLDVSSYIVFADKLPFKKTIHLINEGAENSEIEITTSQPNVFVRYPFDTLFSRAVLPKGGRLPVTIEVPVTFKPVPSEITVTFKAKNGGDKVVTVVRVGEGA